MAPVYKKDEQHCNPVENAQIQTEGIVKTTVAQNAPSVAIPAKVEKGSPKQESKPLSAMLEIKDETFQKIKELFEQKAIELWNKVEGPISRREQFEILFGILKNGGGFGLAYEPNQDPKTKEERPARMPQEMLEAGKGDCNEFSLLFVVSAQKLGLEISDVNMVVMDLAIRSSDKRESHAAIITTQDGSYLLDLAFLKELHRFTPADPKNVRGSEISEFYTISEGIRGVGYIDGVVITERADSLDTMLAINLRETIGVYERKLEKVGGSEKETLLLQIVNLLEEAHTLDPGNIKIQKKLVAHYVSLADEAFEKGRRAAGTEVQNRYFELARRYCGKAIELYEKCKGSYAEEKEAGNVAEIRKNVYHAHDLASKIYEKEGEMDKVMLELDYMIKLQPENVLGHSNKMRYLYNMAATAENASEGRKYLLEAKNSGETALKVVDYFGRTEIEEVLKIIELRLEKYEE